MDFKDKLSEYIEMLGCTGKELSEASGISAATISRYRSGERVPDTETENFANLVEGIVHIAERKNRTDLTVQSVSDAFAPYVRNNTIDVAKLQENFNVLLTVLPVSISELSRFLNFDASHISRIRNGQRQPANPQEFAAGVSSFVARRYSNDTQRNIVSELICCKPEELSDYSSFQSMLAEWLLNGTGKSRDYMSGFLEKLDEFDLNEYIRAIHFDEWKVPSVPFQLPTSKTYFGLKEFMDSELAFLKATVLSKSKEPVIMYSDMPMGEMAKDPDFPKKWMFGMAMMLKKGLHLNHIHNIDRSFEEMMLGLESWIPMYMTGQVSPYYLKNVQGNIFSHFLKVSGSVALTGEAISGYHTDGKYYLTKNKEEVAYYKKRAKQLLSKAYPLMEIFRSEQAQTYNRFLQDNAETAGNRYYILSSLSLHTITDELLHQILSRNNIPETDALQIRQHVILQRGLADKIMRHSFITEEIPVLTREEFGKYPIVLPLSGMFYEKDILYSWADYQEHLRLIQDYPKQHPHYRMTENPGSPFRNIQICIHEGKCVTVSKNKTPSIHFLIRHPKMRNAFENMSIPIVES
ncbi:helix-turn-helix domain-containing protein [Mordavella massiliensis]|uniref:helix-turn-helix domain-containing protein n=1 Tax=Mordavella massiliensis TaxID=1871024 RepID=UPI00210E47B7|nr:helix-turn-helix domain-containing protein [Mordavella massiliensis]